MNSSCLAFSKEETASDGYRKEMCELAATEFGTQMKRAMQTVVEIGLT